MFNSVEDSGLNKTWLSHCIVFSGKIFYSCRISLCQGKWGKLQYSWSLLETRLISGWTSTTWLYNCHSWPFFSTLPVPRSPPRNPPPPLPSVPPPESNRNSGPPRLPPRPSPALPVSPRGRGAQPPPSPFSKERKLPASPTPSG